MRTAYSGRAAAYEKKGDFDKALADHKMAVLYYALEAEILNGLDAPDRSKVIGEAAGAYRARAQCYESLRLPQEAKLDRKRADDLDESARQLTKVSTSAKQPSATEVHVFNSWAQPITLIVDGVSHRVEVGAVTTIPAPAGTIIYEMQAGPHRGQGTLQAGKAYTIRPAAER
jgi:tetratricopeptide (TPR) repeat protein